MKSESEIVQQKLLIIDGHNLLFQMFYGMPASITGKHGKPIHGILGFVGGLLKILRITSPTHAVVIFDGETGSDRSESYPQYKNNRIDYSEVPEEDNPFSQLGDIKKALTCMGIRHFESEGGAEADDVIASYANQFKNGMEVIICSADTDFIQLVCPSVNLLVYRGQQSVIYNTSKVVEKWCVKPECFAAYKALIGDKADNITGIPLVGPKTAAQLISDFGSAEEAVKNVLSIRKKSIRESVSKHSNRFRTNLEIITLDRKVALPFGIDALAIRQDTNFVSTNSILDIGVK